jgi:hypothetical protein
MTMMHDLSSSDTLTSSPHKIITKRKGDKLEAGKPLKKSKHCRASKAKWSPEEDEILSRAVLMSGEGNWKKLRSPSTIGRTCSASTVGKKYSIQRWLRALGKKRKMQSSQSL